MPRIRICALAILSILLNHTSFAQTSPGNAIDVAYVVEGSTKVGFQVQTYDVDSHTGYPTPEGQPLRLPVSGSVSQTLTYAFVVPAPGDRFVYVVAETYGTNRFIWVYPTDTLGVPDAGPIQTVDIPNTWDFQIDPTGKLAYTIGFTSLAAATVNVRVFTLDPHTGLLSKTARTVQTWGTYGPCGNGDPAWIFLDGFNPESSELYEGWSCVFFDTYGAFYYSSTIDPNQGGLGQPKEIFRWDGSGGDGDGIYFTARFMIDFYDVGGYGWNAVNVYPLTGGSKPLISCTETMLPACGDAVNLYADPAGEYLFLQLPTNTMQVERIDLGAKTIVDTGNYVAEPLFTMSSDRLLLYTLAPGQREPYIFGIYVFNPQTGSVQQGGLLPVEGYFDNLATAVRTSN